jgi:hypothetical protein
MTPGPGRYAMPRWPWRDFRRPVASIRFRTATPVAASVCRAVRPRARSRGPISAFYRHTNLACRAIRAQKPGFPEAMKRRRNLITVSSIIEPPHRLHSIAIVPLCPLTRPTLYDERTSQEQYWTSGSELSEPALACRDRTGSVQRLGGQDGIDITDLPLAGLGTVNGAGFAQHRPLCLWFPAVVGHCRNGVIPPISGQSPAQTHAGQEHDTDMSHIACRCAIHGGLYGPLQSCDNGFVEQDPPMRHCCADRCTGRKTHEPMWIHAKRTEIGRPSSSIRFRT